MLTDADPAALLEALFARAEETQGQGSCAPEISAAVEERLDVLFRSRTQSYREALLGCALARARDRTIDISLPYIEQGPRSFSGRTMDEKVVNPFLQARRVSCSRGPYLAVFRRKVRFDATLLAGLKDKEAGESFLALIAALKSIDNDGSLRQFVLAILCRFVALREEATVPLAQLQRASLGDCGRLISALVVRRSGGRLPVMVVHALLLAADDVLRLGWAIAAQAINEADAASGAGGDLVVTRDGAAVLTIEVTERTVGQERLLATFNHKIVTAGLRNYLFVAPPPEPAVLSLAARLFAQGYDVDFVELADWARGLLALCGSEGRSAFVRHMQGLLAGAGVPATLRAYWNEAVAGLVV